MFDFTNVCRALNSRPAETNSESILQQFNPLSGFFLPNKPCVMPTTRRSTGGARARQGPAKGQSTISFSNRVSKPGVKQDLKKSTITPKKADEVTAAKSASQDELDEELNTPEVVDIEVEAEEAEPEEKEEVLEKSEAELRAEKITDAQIGKYWKAIEAERIAPRVHVGDLSTGEKVLRYFDVSSQYGVRVPATFCLSQAMTKLTLSSTVEYKH